MAILHKRDEGYVLNPLLHPWPPVPKLERSVGAHDLRIEDQLDAERSRREQRLVKAGYADKKW
jgi:hypothetical protein